ncbi:hydrolase [uncultured Dokdonia sp.]|uniref:hydrolase n=1 Tax=uncultured Dokdonia sp. TaxID=575653 RepID=UPI002613B844|nr:hydrolase [uncultured Dokdonia sp.]
MKRNIFLYLFLFAALWIVYQYVHNKKFYENQQQRMTKLETKYQKAVDSIDVLQQRLGETEYFGLRSNANAYEYYEDSPLGIPSIIQLVTDGIIEKNTLEGNVFIPYQGDERAYQINQIHLLNHRWLIADFSDGNTWGELLIEYFVNEDNSIDYRVIDSLLYPL